METYVLNGESLTYTAGQLAAKAAFPAQPCPAGALVWSDTLMAWEDPRTPSQIKESLTRMIKARRDARQEGGTKVGEKWFHSDSASRIQQLGLVIMGASIPAGLMWKTMDKSYITMTQTLAMQIFGAVAQSDGLLFARAEQIEAAMLASTDPKTFDYMSGWPPVFGES